MALVPGGGQAEEVVVDRGSLLPVPDDFSDIEAGAFPEVYLTAYLNLFMLGGLDSGGTALVHGGSGGVGTAAIQLAKEAGARIFVTAGSADRCRRCRDLGADHRRRLPRTRISKPRVSTPPTSRGVDVVLDCIGGLVSGEEPQGADHRGPAGRDRSHGWDEGRTRSAPVAVEANPDHRIDAAGPRAPSGRPRSWVRSSIASATPSKPAGSAQSSTASFPWNGSPTPTDASPRERPSARSF